MTLSEIAELTDEHISSSRNFYKDDSIYDDICLLLKLLNHCSVCLAQKMDAQLEGLPYLAMSCKATISTGDKKRVALTLITEDHLLPDRTISGYLPFQTMSFLLFLHLISAKRVLRLSFLLYCTSRHISRRKHDTIAATRTLSDQYNLGDHICYPFYSFECSFFFLLNIRRKILLQEVWRNI